MISYYSLIAHVKSGTIRSPKSLFVLPWETDDEKEKVRFKPEEVIQLQEQMKLKLKVRKEEENRTKNIRKKK